MMSFLVLAHHRSGSNFLGDVLQAHPDVDCLSEPLSMHTSAYLPLDLVRWNGTDYRPDCLHESLRRLPEAVSFTRDLAAYVAQSSSGRVRGFKETLGFEKLGWFARVFPGLRMVWLVRDPRAVVRAVVSRNMERLWDYGGALRRYATKHGRELPFPILTGTAVDRVVSSWQVRLWEARRTLGILPTAMLRFEDVVTDPAAELARVMPVVGASLHAAQLAFIEASHSGPSRGGAYSTVRNPESVLNAWRTELTTETISSVERRLRREMEWLGYD